MDEIIRHLPPGSRVLDVGSLTGSFPADLCPGSLVARVDLEAPPPGACPDFVQADAARLPFPDHVFDAVVANHSLEHIHGLQQALAEIGRVARPGAGLFVAVPDASTFSDWLFRWVYRGESGHINPFRSRAELAATISNATGLPLTGARDLYSSFEYLNRYYFPKGTPWRLRLIGNGTRFSILVLSYATRLFDQLFGTRTSRYGWALYFGKVGQEVESAPWANVCVACGAASPSAWLQRIGAVRRKLGLFRTYRCPSCNARNFFTSDPIPSDS